MNSGARELDAGLMSKRVGGEEDQDLSPGAARGIRQVQRAELTRFLSRGL